MEMVYPALPRLPFRFVDDMASITGSENSSECDLAELDIAGESRAPPLDSSFYNMAFVINISGKKLKLALHFGKNWKLGETSEFAVCHAAIMEAKLSQQVTLDELALLSKIHTSVAPRIPACRPLITPSDPYLLAFKVCPELDLFVRWL